MSLKPQPISPVPEETARIARAAYPKGNVYLHMRDELGTIYEDESFTTLFSKTGQPAEAPWRLALVTVIQFAEGLIRPTSGRCGARSYRYQVCPQPRAHGPRL